MPQGKSSDGRGQVKDPETDGRLKENQGSKGSGSSRGGSSKGESKSGSSKSGGGSR